LLFIVFVHPFASQYLQQTIRFKILYNFTLNDWEEPSWVMVGVALLFRMAGLFVLMFIERASLNPVKVKKIRGNDRSPNVDLEERGLLQ
jgi:hypothetical protein